MSSVSLLSLQFPHKQLDTFFLCPFLVVTSLGRDNLTHDNMSVCGNSSIGSHDAYRCSLYGKTVILGCYYTHLD